MGRDKIPTDDLLNELQQLADTLGRTPTTEEMDKQGQYSSLTYANRFGSWNDAVQEAGLSPNKQGSSSIATDELLEELQRLAGTFGRAPTKEEMNEQGQYSSQPYVTQFGSWTDAVQEAGLSPNKSGSPIAIEELLEELQRLADTLGRAPTTKEMDEQGQYSCGTYLNRFESWHAALQEADLSPNKHGGSRIATKELIGELQRLADTLGRAPTQEEMNEQGRYSCRPYIYRFESWNNAVQEAGLSPNKHGGSRIATEELLEELQRLADTLGRAPTKEEMNEQGQYSYGPYIYRFESWNNAVQEAGLSPHQSGSRIATEELLEEVQRLADTLGRTPTTKEMDEQGQYSYTPYSNRFESWSDALQEAGIQ